MMSSKSLDKKVKGNTIFDVEQHLRLKNLITPFSKFSKVEKYIYYGYEKIPFKERLTSYQKIIRHEFAEEMKEFMNSIKK